MSKYVLETEFDYDFSLFAISSHEPDYKICIYLNKSLHINLTNDIPIELSTKGIKEPLRFNCYSYVDEEEQIEFNLLCNKSMNSVLAPSIKGAPSLFEEPAQDMKGILMPELPQSDFFLLLKSNHHINMKEEILAKIKAIDVVLSVQHYKPETLISKKNLII